MMTSTVKALMTDVAPLCYGDRHRTKVTIVGAGSVGSAIAFTLLAQKICTDVVLIDQDEPLAKGEAMDIMHAIMYLGNVRIVSSSDYDEAAGSEICIITVGREPLRASQKAEIVKANTAIYREIIPPLAAAAPDSILIVCSYPVDMMAYVAYKLSNFPSHRVFGSGTILLSARFKALVCEKLKVNSKSVNCYVIGENGKRSIPVFSAVSLIGIRFNDVNPNVGTPEDPEDWRDLHEEVVLSSTEVVTLKSCRSWGLAISMGRIVKGILNDTKECMPLSTYIKGCRHGADKDVFLSLPCVLGKQGIQSIIRLNLSEIEKKQLQKSADTLHEMNRRFFLDVGDAKLGDVVSGSGGADVEQVGGGEDKPPL